MIFTWNPNWPYPSGKSWEPELLDQEYEGFVSKHDSLVCGILTANHSHQYIYIYTCIRQLKQMQTLRETIPEHKWVMMLYLIWRILQLSGKVNYK